MSQLRRRRDVLKLSALAVAAVPTACYRSAVDPLPLSDAESAAFFPQSVASGDPRPDSIVLWVRVDDAARLGRDVELALVMALDAELTQTLQLSAEAESLVTAADGDFCLQVRVGGLQPGTTYYYRFSYTTLDGIARSRIGRTRTAPAEDSDAPVKFAVLCCQDYAGKYFHAARHIAEQDVDFVLHLGDYVYESAGNPAFQSPTDERRVVFSAPEEALELGRGDSTYLAAQSLSNYRDLYKLYRSDPDLQALHERHPIIAIWDDHEFADDCHGDVATYRDGRVDETSPERRAAADQAWFEHMPIDYSTAPASKLDKHGEFPDNFAIYRSFVFGRHVELILTDLRRFRPDHLVPEDAPPGEVFLTAAEVAAFEAEPPGLVPYVDLDADAYGDYRAALLDNAAALDITAESLRGNFSAVWINAALASLGDAALPAAIDVEDASLERGFAYHCIGKSQQFSRIGSRYVVAITPFEALAQKLWQASRGKSEQLMGAEQRAWFLKTMQESTRTFKLWGSEIALQPRHIDLSGIPAAPDDLRTQLSISAEDWDGFPNERRALLKELAGAGNVVILSGDLHSFFAGTPYAAEGDEDARVVELTTGSATSTTWLDSIQESFSQDSNLPMSVQLLVQLVPGLLRDTDRRPNPHLAFQELESNGYSLIEVGPDDVLMTVRTIASKHVATPPGSLKGSLDDLFGRTRFRTRSGSAELEQEIDGEFLTWSRKEMAFQ
jgi:alkaline phosphatase D